MKKTKSSIFFLSLILALSWVLCLSAAYGSRSDVEAFVTRFYQQCLGREPEQAGLDGWVNALLNGTLCGSDVANGFIFSQEFIDRNTSNEDFVTILYRAFFGREPDAAGYVGWVNYLYSGASRSDALDGFISSQEFFNLCDVYGINSSSIAAVGPPNVILKGSINKTTDYFGDIKLLGELKNTGGNPAVFTKINITFYGANSNVVGTDFTYIDGSNMTLSTSGIETDTILVSNEVGGFELYTNVDAALVASYSYSISFETYDVVMPKAKLDVIGNITTQRDYLGYLDLLGTVQNTGSKGLTFGKISFVIKNSAGLVIDTDFTYINGENVYLTSINTYTDTALNVGSDGSFSVSTLADFYQFASYYYKTSWDDADIHYNIVYSVRKMGSARSTFQEFETEKQRRQYRDSETEKLRIYLEQTQNNQ